MKITTTTVQKSSLEHPDSPKTVGGILLLLSEFTTKLGGSETEDHDGYTYSRTTELEVEFQTDNNHNVIIKSENHLYSLSVDGVYLCHNVTINEFVPHLQKIYK